LADDTPGTTKRQFRDKAVYGQSVLFGAPKCNDERVVENPRFF
jgi:hypothetical protein